MSLFTDLKEVLTPYANRIKGLAAADEEIKADLDAQVDMLSEQEAVTEVTENLDVSGYGLTLQATEDGRIKIFGTSTAARNYGFLNGQTFIATSASTLTKTLEAGTYVIEHGITGSQENYIIRGTYSTFANFFNIATANIERRIIVTFEQDVTIAFASPTDRDYGTEESASYLTFKASLLISKDEKARADLSAMAETIGDIEQALSDTQTEIEGIKTDSDGQLYKIPTTGNISFKRYVVEDGEIVEKDEGEVGTDYIKCPPYVVITFGENETTARILMYFYILEDGEYKPIWDLLNQTSSTNIKNYLSANNTKPSYRSSGQYFYENINSDRW